MNSDKERVGQALEAALKYRRRTQEQLADLVGVHRLTIRRYVNAESMMSAATAGRIEEALDLPPGLLTRPPETWDEAMETIADWTATRRAERQAAGGA